MCKVSELHAKWSFMLAIVALLALQYNEQSFAQELSEQEKAKMPNEEKKMQNCQIN